MDQFGGANGELKAPMQYFTQRNPEGAPAVEGHTPFSREQRTPAG